METVISQLLLSFPSEHFWAFQLLFKSLENNSIAVVGLKRARCYLTAARWIWVRNVLALQFILLPKWQGSFSSSLSALLPLAGSSSSDFPFLCVAPSHFSPRTRPLYENSPPSHLHYGVFVVTDILQIGSSKKYHWCCGDLSDWTLLLLSCWCAPRSGISRKVSIVSAVLVNAGFLQGEGP